MLKAFQKALTEALSAVVNTREYRGELSTPEKAKLLAQELPLVMVDFVGDTHVGALKKVAEFNLYLVHVSFSRNTTARETTRLELVELLERVDETISSKSFADSKYVQLGRARKLFDGQSGTGYLTAFVRTFHVELRI